MRFSNVFSWTPFCHSLHPASIHSSEIPTPAPEPPNTFTHSGVPHWSQHKPIHDLYSAPNTLPCEPPTPPTSSIVHPSQVFLLPIFSPSPKSLPTCTIFPVQSFLLAFLSDLTSRSLGSYTLLSATPSHLHSLLLCCWYCLFDGHRCCPVCQTWPHCELPRGHLHSGLPLQRKTFFSPAVRL